MRGIYLVRSSMDKVVLGVFVLAMAVWAFLITAFAFGMV